MKLKTISDHIKQGRAKDITDDIQSLSSRLSDCENYHQCLGWGCMMAGDYQKAIMSFNTAAQYTSAPDMLINMGICYEKTGDMQKAEATLN